MARSPAKSSSLSSLRRDQLRFAHDPGSLPCSPPRRNGACICIRAVPLNTLCKPEQTARRRREDRHHRLRQASRHNPKRMHRYRTPSLRTSLEELQSSSPGGFPERISVTMNNFDWNSRPKASRLFIITDHYRNQARMWRLCAMPVALPICTAAVRSLDGRPGPRLRQGMQTTIRESRAFSPNDSETAPTKLEAVVTLDPAAEQNHSASVDKSVPGRYLLSAQRFSPMPFPSVTV